MALCFWALEMFSARSRSLPQPTHNITYDATSFSLILQSGPGRELVDNARLLLQEIFLYFSLDSFIFSKIQINNKELVTILMFASCCPF